MSHPPPQPQNAHSRIGFRITGVITLAMGRVTQTQYATDLYVLTEVDRFQLLFAAERGERFIVDQNKRFLQRIDTARQSAWISQLRSDVEEPRIIPEDLGDTVVDGYPCRHIRVCGEGGGVLLQGEIYCTQISGLDQTCLHRDRLVGAGPESPSGWLQRDEVIVSSFMEASSTAGEYRQEYRLSALERDDDNARNVDPMLTLPVIPLADNGPSH